MFKKIVKAGMVAVLCFMTTVPAAATSSAPVTHGQAVLLLDGVSGQILYQRNGQETNFPASTTKLLTALVAVERGKLDQRIKVSARAVDQAPDSSSCYLEQGEEQSLEYLLYGLMLASGNDCAIAIAEGVAGGNMEQFVTWMNERAKSLGAIRSHFTNPHGLHDPNHYTTALDLALIARGALTNPTVLKMAGTKQFMWPGKSEKNGPYYNHNALLFTYEGAVGGKTGFTEEAGLTLVGAAKRNGRFLIGITMGEEHKTYQYADMTALLDYGFVAFEEQQAIQGGTSYGTVAVANGRQESVAVAAGKAFPVLTLKGQPPNVKVVPKLAQSLTAPVAASQEAGVLEIREGDRVLGAVPVVTGQAVEVKQAFMTLTAARALVGLKWFAYVLGGLLLFRTVVKTTRRMLRKSRGFSGGSHRSSSRTGTITYYRPKSR